MAEPWELELVVENFWIVETLKALGSGHILHLTYPDMQVDPDTLTALAGGDVPPGTLGSILTAGPPRRRVATFELTKVNKMEGFTRLDFRLLSVSPFTRTEVFASSPYLCSRHAPSA